MHLSSELRLLVYALAVIRGTYLLWWENGPGEVFNRLRTWAGVYVELPPVTLNYGNPPVPMEPVRKADTFLGKLLLCPYCISVWLAIPATLGFLLNSWLIDVIAMWLAISGLAVIVFNCMREEKLKL